MNSISEYLSFNEGEFLIDDRNIMEEYEESKQCIEYFPEIPLIYFYYNSKIISMFTVDLKKISKDQKNGKIDNFMEIVKLPI